MNTSFIPPGRVTTAAPAVPGVAFAVDAPALARAHPHGTLAVSMRAPPGPPATPGTTAQVLQQVLGVLAAQPDESVAISLSLPFCAVHCLCCNHCERAGQPPQVVDGRVDSLCHEINTLAGHIGGQRELMQLHLGGGSANVLSACNLVG